VYYVDGERGEDSTWELIDHETWMLNFTKSNLEGSPSWYKEYSASEYFGLDGHRPQDYYELTLRMVEDKTLFEKYRRVYHKDSYAVTSVPCPDLDCIHEILCHTVKHNVKDRSACDRLRQLLEDEENTQTSSGVIILPATTLLLATILFSTIPGL